jgi:hypothetical protein
VKARGIRAGKLFMCILEISCCYAGHLESGGARELLFGIALKHSRSAETIHASACFFSPTKTVSSSVKGTHKKTLWCAGVRPAARALSFLQKS